MSPLFKTGLITAGMLALSNMFMTYAWYGHLKHLKDRTWYVAALLSWAVALLEYMIMVPANRIGFRGGLGLFQLKLMQETLTLIVFVPFALLVMRERWKWDYLFAMGCLMGAVYFTFRE